MHWISTNDSQRQGEKLALIQEIIDAMPEPDIIRLLYDIFVTRCQGPLANVVHTPTFKSQAGKLCDCLNLASPEAQAMALSSTMSMDILACHLLAVRMSVYHASCTCLLSSYLTARACSRVPSHTIYTWLDSYTSDFSCGRASSVRCISQDVEVTRLALPSRRGGTLLWFDCQFTSRHHAFARWPRGIIPAGRNLSYCNLWSPETRFASTGWCKVESLCIARLFL